VNIRIRTAAVVTLFAGIASAVLALSGATASAVTPIATSSLAAVHIIQPMGCGPKGCL